MIDLLALPKTELHLHFEGAVPLETLLQLIHKYGDEADVPDLQSLRAKFCYRDFQDFLRTHEWTVGYLREYEDFCLAGTALARKLAAQGVWYAEISFSPGMFERHGLKLQPLAQAIRAGLSQVLKAGEHHLAVRTNLIVDLIRNRGPSQGERRKLSSDELTDPFGIKIPVSFPRWTVQLGWSKGRVHRARAGQ